MPFDPVVETVCYVALLLKAVQRLDLGLQLFIVAIQRLDNLDEVSDWVWRVTHSENHPRNCDYLLNKVLFGVDVSKSHSREGLVSPIEADQVLEPSPILHYSSSLHPAVFWEELEFGLGEPEAGHKMVYKQVGNWELDNVSERIADLESAGLGRLIWHITDGCYPPHLEQPEQLDQSENPKQPVQPLDPYNP